MNFRRAAIPRFQPLAIAALSGLLALAGCGGGGSADPGSPAATPPIIPTTPTTPTPPPGVDGRQHVGLEVGQVAGDARARGGDRRRAGATCGSHGAFPAAADLTWNAALTQAAAAHSDDMVAGNFFSHTGSNGSTLGSRATAAGYAWSALGENIAAGQSTVEIVVDGWMKSDGHCANLMNANFREIGAACVAGNANTTYRTYWTQDFGTPR